MSRIMSLPLSNLARGASSHGEAGHQPDAHCRGGMTRRPAELGIDQALPAGRQRLADDTGVLLLEDIAHAANGMDEPWFALRLELVAQVANVDFQDIR